MLFLLIKYLIHTKLTKIKDKVYTNTFTPYFPSLAYDLFLKGVVSVTSGKPLPDRELKALKRQRTLEILDECPSYNLQRLLEFYKKMGFPH